MNSRQWKHLITFPSLSRIIGLILSYRWNPTRSVNRFLFWVEHFHVLPSLWDSSWVIYLALFVPTLQWILGCPWKFWNMMFELWTLLYTYILIATNLFNNRVSHCISEARRRHRNNICVPFHLEYRANNSNKLRLENALRNRHRAIVTEHFNIFIGADGRALN